MPSVSFSSFTIPFVFTFFRLIEFPIGHRRRLPRALEIENVARVDTNSFYLNCGSQDLGSRLLILKYHFKLYGDQLV